MVNASLNDINKVIEHNDLNEPPLETNVSKQFHEFLLLFNKVLAEKLPPHLPGINYQVKLKEGETATSGRLYSLKTAESVLLKERLDEHMSKGFIPHSFSPG